jgi:transposase-like protein
MAKQLTTDQYVAIEWLSLPDKGGKTYEEIAEICGVHPNTIANWRKDAFFDREFKRAIIRNNSGRLPEMIRALAESAIKDGNAAAGKLILQVNEMLTDRLEVDTKDNANTDIEALSERLKAFKRTGDNGDSQDSV